MGMGSATNNKSFRACGRLSNRGLRSAKACWKMLRVRVNSFRACGTLLYRRFRILKACSQRRRRPKTPKNYPRRVQRSKVRRILPNRPENCHKRADCEEKRPEFNKKVSRKHQKGTPNRPKMLPKRSWKPVIFQNRFGDDFLTFFRQKIDQKFMNFGRRNIRNKKNDNIDFWRPLHGFGSLFVSKKSKRSARNL